MLMGITFGNPRHGRICNNTRLRPTERRIARIRDFWRDTLPTKSVRLSDRIAFDIRVHDKPDSWVSRLIMRDGIWAPDETAVILDRLKEGDLFVDVGANIGWFTVLASEIVGKDGQVWAYEPDPDNYAILEDNVSHRDNVMAFDSGLSDHDGTIDLFRSSTNLGDHRMFASDDRESICVDVETFGSYVNDIDFIKIDVQGHEGRVLIGMADYFCNRRRKRPLILVELWPNGMDASGASPEFTLELLKFYGYHVPDLTATIKALRSTSDFEAHTTILFEPK